MWRKLTSLLFEEEEIILEEEIVSKEELAPEEIRIKPVQPLIDKKLEEQALDTIEIEAIPNDSQVDFVVEPLKADSDKKHKKSVMIDLEDTESTKEIKVDSYRATTSRRTKDGYKKRSILSPMHGGTTEDTPKPKAVSHKVVKKHKPVTQIISPMYGNIHEEKSNEELLEDELMDLDLKSMIYEEEGDDEVQTSLYDFLEGLEKEHE